MSEITFKNVWQKEDQSIAQSVVDLWTKNKILPADVAPEERVKEICGLAYDGNEVVGVTTCTIRYMGQLRSHAAFVRCFIEPGHRAHSTGRNLTAETKIYLSDWSEANPELQVRGMAVVVQSAIIKAMPRFGVPVWNKTKLFVIGFTEDDDQVRFTWFDHIILPGEWD